MSLSYRGDLIIISPPLPYVNNFFQLFLIFFNFDFHLLSKHLLIPHKYWICLGKPFYAFYVFFYFLVCFCIFIIYICIYFYILFKKLFYDFFVFLFIFAILSGTYRQKTLNITSFLSELQRFIFISFRIICIVFKNIFTCYLIYNTYLKMGATDIILSVTPIYTTTFIYH